MPSKLSNDEGGAEVEEEKAKKGIDAFGQKEEETLVSRVSKMPEERASEIPKGRRASDMSKERASDTPSGKTLEMSDERVPKTLRREGSRATNEGT